MAKRDNDYQEQEFPTEQEIVHSEETRIVELTNSDMQKFERYVNIFEHSRIKDIMPDFYAGEALIGLVIAIHHYVWAESFQYKVPFVQADIEIAGHGGQAKAAFFSVAAKTFFKGLDSVGVQLPIVVGVKRQGNTYTFCDPNELLKR